MLKLDFEIPDYASYLGGAFAPAMFSMDVLHRQIALTLANAHARAVERKAKANAPVKSGKLRDSIRAQITGLHKGVLAVHAPYATYLHEGTGVHGPKGKPYKITPRKKLALNWPGAGHPVRAVVHEGIKPRDFLRLAMRRAHTEMQATLAQMRTAMNQGASANAAAIGNAPENDTDKGSGKEDKKPRSLKCDFLFMLDTFECGFRHPYNEELLKECNEEAIWRRRICEETGEYPDKY
jgi:HK97 gp10 family phage protein